MNVHHLPERRRVAPYIQAGCDQQGRQNDGTRATCPDITSCRMPICACRPVAAEGYAETELDRVDSMRAHRRMAAWARGVLLSILTLLALVGAGALYGAAERHFTTEPTTTTTTTRTTT